MYKNLLRSIDDEGYEIEFISEFLNISNRSFINKVAGVSNFTLQECIKLCKLLDNYEPCWLLWEDSDSESHTHKVKILERVKIEPNTNLYMKNQNIILELQQ